MVLRQHCTIYILNSWAFRVVAIVQPREIELWYRCMKDCRRIDNILRRAPSSAVQLQVPGARQ